MKNSILIYLQNKMMHINTILIFKGKIINQLMINSNKAQTLSQMKIAQINTI